MTNTAILTPEAQAYLERYLRKVRGALRGHRAVDADDVERDVICHVSAELGQPGDPVSTAQLRMVRAAARPSADGRRFQFVRAGWDAALRRCEAVGSGDQRGPDTPGSGAIMNSSVIVQKYRTPLPPAAMPWIGPTVP